MHKLPPPTAKTSLFLFFYVSFPSSSVSGLLLGTLRRRGDERETVSGENRQLNEGGPRALIPAAARHHWDEASPEWDVGIWVVWFTLTLCS